MENLSQPRVRSQSQQPKQSKPPAKASQIPPEVQKLAIQVCPPPTPQKPQEFIICDKSIFIEYSGQRTIHGFMKKLCNDNSWWITPSFEMRFCTLDLSCMLFRYAKSPKDAYTELCMDEIIFAGFTDPQRTKPLKTKNLHEQKFLLHIRTLKRTYVFSVSSRNEHIMWGMGFNAFFIIKAYFQYYNGQIVIRNSQITPRQPEQEEEESKKQILEKKNLKQNANQVVLEKKEEQRLYGNIEEDAGFDCSSEKKQQDMSENARLNNIEQPVQVEQQMRPMSARNQPSANQIKPRRIVMEEQKLSQSNAELPKEQDNFMDQNNTQTNSIPQRKTLNNPRPERTTFQVQISEKATEKNDEQEDNESKLQNQGKLRTKNNQSFENMRLGRISIRRIKEPSFLTKAEQDMQMLLASSKNDEQETQNSNLHQTSDNDNPFIDQNQSTQSLLQKSQNQFNTNNEEVKQDRPKLMSLREKLKLRSQLKASGSLKLIDKEADNKPQTTNQVTTNDYGQSDSQFEQTYDVIYLNKKQKTEDSTDQKALQQQFSGNSTQQIGRFSLISDKSNSVNGGGRPQGIGIPIKRVVSKKALMRGRMANIRSSGAGVAQDIAKQVELTDLTKQIELSDFSSTQQIQTTDLVGNQAQKLKQTQSAIQMQTQKVAINWYGN